MPQPADQYTDKIWITFKTRIYAEKRLQNYAFWSHLLMTYYAIFLIAAQFLISPDQTPDLLTKLNIFLSIVVLIFSLLIYGFRFEERAAKHRDCYLRLQRLLDAGYTPKKTLDLYHEVIDGYPNHIDQDYNNFLVETILLYGQDVVSRGNKLKAGGYRVLIYVITRMRNMGILLTLFASPAVVLKFAI